MSETVTIDRARLEALEADKARLDWLDRMNAGLNQRYGTAYRWRLILNHNVTRLLLGDFLMDLHDTEGGKTGLTSCRDAIDEVRLSRR